MAKAEKIPKGTFNFSELVKKYAKIKDTQPEAASFLANSLLNFAPAPFVVRYLNATGDVYKGDFIQEAGTTHLFQGDVIFQGKVAGLEPYLRPLEQKISAVDARVTNLESLTSQMALTIQDILGRLDAHDFKLDYLEEQLRNQGRLTEDLETKITNAQGQIDSIQALLEAQTVNLQNVMEEIETLITQVTDIYDIISGLQGISPETLALIDAIKADVEQLKKDIQSPPVDEVLDTVDFVEDLDPTSEYSIDPATGKLTLPATVSSVTYIKDPFTTFDSTQWSIDAASVVISSILYLNELVYSLKPTNMGKDIRLELALAHGALESLTSSAATLSILLSLDSGAGINLLVSYDSEGASFSVGKGSATICAGSVKGSFLDGQFRTLVLERNASGGISLYFDGNLITSGIEGETLGNVTKLSFLNTSISLGKWMIDNVEVSKLSGSRTYATEGTIKTKSMALRSVIPIKEVIVGVEADLKTKLVTVGEQTQFYEDFSVVKSRVNRASCYPEKFDYYEKVAPQYYYNSIDGRVMYIYAQGNAYSPNNCGLIPLIDLTTLPKPIIVTCKCYVTSGAFLLGLLDEIYEFCTPTPNYLPLISYFGWWMYIGAPDGGGSTGCMRVFEGWPKGSIVEIKYIITEPSSNTYKWQWYIFDEDGNVKRYVDPPVTLISPPKWLSFGFRGSPSYGDASNIYIDKFKVETGTSVQTQIPGSYTVDLSLDDGANYLTNIPVGKIIDVTGAPFGGAGCKPIIRVNLATTDASISPVIKNISLMTRTTPGFVKAKINEIIDTINEKLDTTIQKL